MLFSEVLGQPHIKSHLTTTADKGRIPHAQLFAGSSGSGLLPMAIAYAQYLLCKNNGQEKTKEFDACNIKMNQLAHPDLHFVFPVASTDKIKKNPVSSSFSEEWRNFLKNNPYGELYEWYQLLGVENKQGQIGVLEAQEITKALSLKSYEGGYKVMIVWMAEKMNTACANKLLKLIEEPPKDTIFLLITEEEENILQTIRSRCQVLHFPPLNQAVIAEGLVSREACDHQTAMSIAQRANGNFGSALRLFKNNSSEEQFEEWFVSWVRTAFKAKGNKSAILDLLSWGETIAGAGREVQKKFLLFCLDLFRQALLQNYQAGELVYMSPAAKGFKLENFSPFISGTNIIGIMEELEQAIYHIERNGNPKIILTDLSIKLTRLLHSK